MKKTPLHEYHKNLGAKLVDFAGFEMPIQYQSIIDEHLFVENRVVFLMLATWVNLL